ncbi:MAG: hypothetical protein WAO52_13725 [Prolixibacteraceae bacterium]
MSTFDKVSNAQTTTCNNGTENGLLSDTVHAIAIDQNEIKFIGTSKGLSILKQNKWNRFLGRTGEEIRSKYRISELLFPEVGLFMLQQKAEGCRNLNLPTQFQEQLL